MIVHLVNYKTDSKSYVSNLNYQGFLLCETCDSTLLGEV